MSARLDKGPRSDKGGTRKYASTAERDAARKKQKLAAQAKWRDANREKIRAASAEYRMANKEMVIARTVAWQKLNPERTKDSVYRRKYGMTLEQVNALKDRQGGCCAICMTPAPLVVDHCHSSAEVRGLLCDRCNVGLGCFSDNEARLTAAALYIAGYATLVVKRLQGETL